MTKRSRNVTLILLGGAALGACTDDRTAPPRPFPLNDGVALEQTLALPHRRADCDRPDDFPLPECHQGGSAPTAAVSHPSGGGYGSAFVFLQHGSPTAYGPATPTARSYAGARASAPLSATLSNGTALARAAAVSSGATRGGFGATGRAVMAASAAS